MDLSPFIRTNRTTKQRDTRRSATVWFTGLLIIVLLLPVLAPVRPLAAQTDGADQPQPDFREQRPFGSDDDWNSSVAVGDLDGDGDLDIVAGNQFVNRTGQNMVYLNDGTAGFSDERPFGPGTDNTVSVAVGDLDGDGDLDIVAGNNEQQSVAYFNDGSGRFHAGEVVCGTTRTVACFGSPQGLTTDVVLGDLNGDGDLDIVLGKEPLSVEGRPAGSEAVRNRVYLNDGTGSFPDAAARPFGPANDRTTDLALADLNGDKALDIVVTRLGEQNTVYLNDGSGTFPDERKRNIGDAEELTFAVDVGDLNGDGYLDIVTGTMDGSYVVLLNDAAQPGNFLDGGTFPTNRQRNGVTGLALGDLNGDGELDVVMSLGVFGDSDTAPANAVAFRIQPAENDGRIAFTASQPFGIEGKVTHSVAPGDMDGDGYLDIVTGSATQNMLFLNRGPGRFGSEPNVISEPTFVRSGAVGDINGDGYLDIVTGSHLNKSVPTFMQNRVYLNDGSGDFPARLSSSFGSDNQETETASLALGDLDGDGDLDVVAGGVPQYTDNNSSGMIPGSATSSREMIPGSAQNMIYLNDGSGRFPQARPLGHGGDSTASLALGDLDSDGDLDIVTGNVPQLVVPSAEVVPDSGRNAVYLNDGSGTFEEEQFFGEENDSTRSLALGDLDKDGDLDIVTGHNPVFTTEFTAAPIPGRNRVYLNDGSGTFGQMRILEQDDTRTEHVAVGDMDGDGDLDIVVGNDGQRNTIYLNDGSGSFSDRDARRNFGTLADTTHTAAVSDMDNDGDLDIVTWNMLDQSAVYLNTGGGFFPYAARRAFGPQQLRIINIPGNLILGDVDNDGDRDVISVGFASGVLLYRNPHVDAAALAHTAPQVSLNRPGPTPAAAFFSTPTILSDQMIPISYTLTGAEGASVGEIRAAYSLDGGGHWQPAVAAPGTQTRNLASAPEGVTHVFNWDTFASGFFGQSDNVVFRIEAYPVPLRGAGDSPGSYQYTRTVPGPYQRPYNAAVSAPFRVRGTQVQVIASTDPVADAVVYRLPAGQQRGGDVISQEASGAPYRTNANGYLRGQSTLLISDTLVAMAPVTHTDSYTLYHTSATPISTTLAAYTIGSPGVQTLRVSPANPLLLLNLDVSLEWDARTDDVFMNRLTFDLQRASELLYDWTNGQAALGDVTVYHAKEKWDDAHIRIYATNVLRPNANQGGIVTTPLSETVTVANETRTITYEPGQVRMGFIWNRSGEAGDNPSEDWARALAHELGHYAFFLDDNYLGLDTTGRLVSVSGCPGAMSDPYRDRYSEFHPQAGWLPACERTLSQQNSGRSDWETITTFYPELVPPSADSFAGINPGPSGLPLEVTRVRFADLIGESEALSLPLFYLSQNGASFRPGPNARVYLFQKDRLIDLGRPTLDQVEAHGVRPGDRLCLYELDAQRLGCEDVRVGDDQLEIHTVSNWQPDIIVTPVTSSTIAITVTNAPAGLSLKAQLYPVSVAAARTLTGSITLAETGSSYAGIFTTDPDAPVLGGYAHVWVEQTGNELRREVVTNFTLGGNPAPVGAGGRSRNLAGAKRGRPSPVTSSDGQVILFGADLDFQVGEYYILQEAVTFPEPPPWATVVGRAYRLAASAGAPDLQNTSISIGYLESDVPPGEEQWLQVYYWDAAQQTWQALPTSLDTAENMAAASTQAAGLYVLMSSIKVQLPRPGWNPIGYPVRETRPVDQALASIEGDYTLVYGYDIDDPVDPWKIYAPELPTPFEPLVNDLDNLEFAQSYWISTTVPLTLALMGSTAPLSTTEQLSASSGMPVSPPPATYYGEVIVEGNTLPQAGIPITVTLMDGTPCAVSRTTQLGDMTGYAMNVPDRPDRPSECAIPGRPILFRLGADAPVNITRWNNDQLYRLTLLFNSHHPSNR